MILIRGPSGTGKSHLTRYLLSLALKCDWLACGRFDLKSGADLDGEFSRFVLNLGVDEAVRAVAGGSPRVRLDGIFSALRAEPSLRCSYSIPLNRVANGHAGLKNTRC